ncbi:MAG TPA: FimV/HubP family polar landmark protein [Eoetvoesiella sp.]
MQMSRCVAVSTLTVRIKPLAVAVSAAMLMCSTAYAASFGHSRIVSNAGEPLRIEVPVGQLSADDQRSLVVVPAQESAWTQAGLKPPVDLSTLQVQLTNGLTPDSRIVQVTSTELFDQPVADLLLNVLTAAGQQQYQVSILAHTKGGPPARTFSSAESSSGVAKADRTQGVVPAGSRDAAQGSIQIRRGDTLSAIAKRNAVSGVSVYQMMIALQRANPQAFINGNINLIKAGATLNIPDMAALTAVSDREARRLFQQQVQAFGAYRQGMAARKTAALPGGSATEGRLSQAVPAPVVQEPVTPRDQVVLSSGSSPTDSSSDSRVATSKGIAESQERISQLEQNVKSLNQALQAQGEAAKDVFVDGAKGLSQSIADVASSVSGTGQPIASGNQLSAVTQSDKPASGSVGSAAAPGAADSGNAAGSSANSSSSNSVTGLTDSSGSGSVAGSGSATTLAGSGNGASQPGNATGGPSSVTQSIDPSSAAAESYAGQGAEGEKSPAGNSAAGIGTEGNNAGKQGETSSQAENVAEQISNKAENSVSWFQEHLLGIVTGLLAFAVLVIAWLLRRANSPREDDHGQVAPITEAMVQEQLNKINLDLRQSPVDETSVPKK